MDRIWRDILPPEHSACSRIQGQNSLLKTLLLLLSHIYANRNARKVEVFSQLVFQEALIGVTHILGQIAKKSKLRVRGR